MWDGNTCRIAAQMKLTETSQPNHLRRPYTSFKSICHFQVRIPPSNAYRTDRLWRRAKTWNHFSESTTKSWVKPIWRNKSNGFHACIVIHFPIKSMYPTCMPQHASCTGNLDCNGWEWRHRKFAAINSLLNGAHHWLRKPKHRQASHWPARRTSGHRGGLGELRSTGDTPQQWNIVYDEGSAMVDVVIAVEM